MDQERISHSLTLKGKITVEMTIQALYALAKACHDHKQYKMDHRTFEGETRFNEFMATKSQKDVEQLLNSEVHLAKLKHYLEEYKVGFSYQQKGEITYLYFESKNRLLAEKAIKDMLAEVTKTPDKLKDFAKNVLRKPHEMLPEEKLAYYKNYTVYKGMSPVVTKDLGKEKAR
ncbi:MULTISPECIES: hypothetical protein [unclassified Streptococcus]|uniref:hypothetical protein n=1 Tax=unclassified Streptococcus TaxID=2608887 RepID=UPI00107185EA|nr:MULTISPECIES: hypothetical protein [unclassified Streptococcus]MBF0786671.1 hypothetical protein [Streptococcus sp. 19428wC2_LYSM12]MCQ9211706.1 hypothetical protein [Streptococcus sp. B01]MCQ9213105.1 hypothetical protein [Streptococcus sp. O1]TFV06423.1 hypothetical protein E4T79_01860 [Streptococcus sp. LYSM12]